MSNSHTPDSNKIDDLGRYEKTILWHGAIWFFFILFAYYILRPIREQISSTYGIENLSWMFAGTFGVMLIAIPTYSYLVGRINRKLLVPLIYIFFISNLILFWIGMTYGTEIAQRISDWLGGQQPDSNRFMSAVFTALDDVDLWIARSLFIWISVYGLFIVSFFWSVMGDMLSTGQSRKIFGYMFGGGTIGGLVGSQVAAFLVEKVGVANLLLIPMALLGAGLILYWLLEKNASKFAQFSNKEASGKATGGNPFAGFTAVFSSRYLFAICLYGLFMATCGTTVYFQQSEIVKAAYAADIAETSQAEPTDATTTIDETQPKSPVQLLAEQKAKEARTKYFANVNFAVSILTLIFQLLIVGILMKRTGLGMTLTMLPLAYVLGITALAISPTIEVLAVVSVLGRAAEYGIANPAKEVLFTSVNREDRYKAKSFIDTIVRRGGDSVIGSAYKYMRESAGFAMTTLSWVIIPVALTWAGLAFFIGFENKKIVKENELEEN